jgi:hypothetical protein
MADQPDTTMIKFPCKCGFGFEVSQEMAGQPLQCPRCMLLNEVPLLSDLADLEQDGTIRMEPVSIEEEGRREAELRRTYLPRRQDDSGDDIDMRNTFDQMADAGADEIPLELKDLVRPGTPKYDPVTGELIKPLTMRGDEAQSVIPIPAGPATLQYQKHYESPGLTMWKAPLLLFTPGSGAVMLFMVGIQLATLGVWVICGAGLLWAGFIPAFVYLMTIAHIANIVEETGPEEKDDLPTPMRGASWYEDIWFPFWRFTVAFAFCYWPALLTYSSHSAWHKLGPVLAPGIAGALALLGSFLFPAVLLITVCSGTYINLRPDRVLGTISAIGGKYLLVAILWCASAGIFVAGTLGGIAWALNLVAWVKSASPPPNIGLSMVLITAGMYLLHMFGWILGGLYRNNHSNFPWAFQRHISTRKIERRKVRHVRPASLEANDPGVLAPELPPPRLHVRPIE